jgi:alkanesulfonate monooxygenase SsuD/methylene tetrahydromethanopterin reductase-like flavin-dependent oxidoreductase (luciferase family)
VTIRNISWNFVGWVDLEDVGFEGTPIDARHHTKEYLSTALRTLEELALVMDPLGYDALYGTEHHFQPEGIEVFPNLLMLGVHLSHLTSNLRFGCAFNILPQWHPLRLAEDYAVADILTRGRVIFGVGRGTQTREAECLGAPMVDQESNRALMEESLELLTLALREESFSWHGEYFDVPPPVVYRGRVMSEITLVPRPLYSNEIWQPISSGSPRGVDLQARLGIKGVLPTLTLDAPDPKVVQYREAAARHGRQLALGEDLAAYLYCHLGDTPETAAREVELFQQESFKRKAGIGGLPTDPKNATPFTASAEDLLELGHPATAAAAARRMGYVSLEEQVTRDRSLLYGPAERIIETIKHIEALYPGLETLILHPPELTHKHIMIEQIQRFADEVMPAFPDAIKRNRTWPDLLADPGALPRYVTPPSVPTPAAVAR